LRQLEDIRQTLTVDDRETLSVVIVRASAIRNSILEAVMGGRNGPSIQ
jgi:hypothetical protein